MDTSGPWINMWSSVFNVLAAPRQKLNVHRAFAYFWGDRHNQSYKLPRKALFCETDPSKCINLYGNLFSADFAGITLRCWLRREIVLARESLPIAACCVDPWWPNTSTQVHQTQVHNYANTQVHKNTNKQLHKYTSIQVFLNKPPSNPASFLPLLFELLMSFPCTLFN